MYWQFILIIFQALSSPVLSAVGERYYKVTAEALRVCGELVRVVRPNIEVSFLPGILKLSNLVSSWSNYLNDVLMQGTGFDFKPYVRPIYNAIMSRLTNQDQDQVSSFSTFVKDLYRVYRGSNLFLSRRSRSVLSLAWDLLSQPLAIISKQNYPPVSLYLLIAWGMR